MPWAPLYHPGPHYHPGLKALVFHFIEWEKSSLAALQDTCHTPQGPRRFLPQQVTGDLSVATGQALCPTGEVQMGDHDQQILQDVQHKLSLASPVEWRARRARVSGWTTARMSPRWPGGQTLPVVVAAAAAAATVLPVVTLPSS